MSSNPYENEPGFESTKVEDKDAAAYAAKVQVLSLFRYQAHTLQIRHETLRITVIQRLEVLLDIASADEPPTEKGQPALDFDDGEDSNPANELFDNSDDALFDPFADLYKQRFLWYYDSYIQSVEKSSEQQKDGKKFVNNQFEYHGNGMTGSFAYRSLKRRLQRVRKALDDETESWAVQGLKAMKDERNVAVNLKRQFEQTVEYYKYTPSMLNLELSLVDNNPFVWHLTFFGQAGSDLYGATINVRIYLSPKFPTEQPRVTVLTPLFHHRIGSTPSTKGRTLVYFPDRSKQHDVRFHIEAIMSAIGEDDPAYDPRTLINLEAASLLWGGEDKKKIYRRKLRRSVQDSMENMDEF